MPLHTSGQPIPRNSSSLEEPIGLPDYTVHRCINIGEQCKRGPNVVACASLRVYCKRKGHAFAQITAQNHHGYCCSLKQMLCTHYCVL